MTKHPTYAKGSIVFVDLEPVVGVEQGRSRPCVVVSDAEMVRQSRARPVYTVVPLTRSESLIGPLAPRLKRREGGLSADSVALTMHVRSIAPERISGRLRGAMNDDELMQIGDGLKTLLGFEGGE